MGKLLAEGGKPSDSSALHLTVTGNDPPLATRIPLDYNQALACGQGTETCLEPARRKKPRIKSEASYD